jgi:two-component system, NarL family, nitrate/nitrite response regulator NarL
MHAVRTMTLVSTKKRVRVVAADDHPLYREGVVRALSASGLIEVVAQVGDGRDALAAIEEQEPDVALLDYKLPSLDGVAIAHAVARDRRSTRVLLLSAFTESGLVYEALQTGAAGYLPKEARREQIVDSVLACARGEAVVPPEMASGLLHPYVLEQAGLEAALRSVAQRSARRAGFDVQLDLRRSRRHPHDGVLLAATRELLSDTAQHAAATTVRIRLAEQNRTVMLEVEDDGLGFDVEQLPGRLAEGHIGLQSQREREESLGGRMEIITAPGGGTSVQIHVPA